MTVPLYNRAVVVQKCFALLNTAAQKEQSGSRSQSGEGQGEGVLLAGEEGTYHQLEKITSKGEQNGGLDDLTAAAGGFFTLSQGFPIKRLVDHDAGQITAPKQNDSSQQTGDGMEQSQQAVDPNGGLSSGGCTGISLLNRLGFREKGEGGLETDGKDQHQGTSGEQRRQQSGQIGSILAVQRLQQPLLLTSASPTGAWFWSP